jgi:hypothetical protein
VTEQALEMAGYEFDEGLGRVIPSADAAALKEKVGQEVCFDLCAMSGACVSLRCHC